MSEVLRTFLIVGGFMTMFILAIVGMVVLFQQSDDRLLLKLEEECREDAEKLGFEFWRVERHPQLWRDDECWVIGEDGRPFQIW